MELLEQELEFSEKKEKSKPKKTQPSLLKRFSDWLMEEDTPKAKPKPKPKKKEKGIWQKFIDWLEEED